MEAISTVDSIVADYETYEDYLDSQITPKDLYYLEDEDLARQLVELGYRGGELRREEFEMRKRNAETIKSKKSSALLPKVLASSGKNVSDSPLLQALADREEMARSGKLAVEILIHLISVYHFHPRQEQERTRDQRLHRLLSPIENRKL